MHATRDFSRVKTRRFSHALLQLLLLLLLLLLLYCCASSHATYAREQPEQTARDTMQKKEK